MITITGTAQRSAWESNQLPPMEQIRDTVWSVPIPFPGSPIRHTFAYLLLDGVGQCIVVDPGWDSDEGRRVLFNGLRQAGVELDAVTGIIATHYHPDHLGMVQTIAESSGAWVGMHPSESQALDDEGAPERMIDRDLKWLQTSGVPRHWIEDLLTTTRTAHYVASLSRATHYLHDRSQVELGDRQLEVVLTPGHTGGHICIIDHANSLVLTGDHVLPRITPNIGHAGSKADGVLAQYLKSLDAIALYDTYEACPAHEYRFRGLAQRCRELRQHHEERSVEMRELLAGSDGLTLWDIAQRVAWRRPWNSLDALNIRGALAETESHVQYLVEQGRAVASNSAGRGTIYNAVAAE